MKHAITRLLQLFKWTSPLALMLLALSLSQSALGQPVFLDVGASNAPPLPGPNDIYETNVLHEFYANGGINYFSDNTGQPGGTTFLTAAANPLGYVITNVYVQVDAAGSGKWHRLRASHRAAILPNQFLSDKWRPERVREQCGLRIPSHHAEHQSPSRQLVTGYVSATSWCFYSPA